MRGAERGIRWGWAALALVLAAGCGRIDPEAELAAARASFEAADYRTAGIRASNVVQAEPENADARALRGQIALALGDAASARAEFERARSLGASPQTIAAGLAEALIRLGENQAALEALEAVEEGGRDAVHWTLRGMALVGAGRLQDAEAAFGRSTAVGGQTPMNLLGRARLAAARNDTAAAEALLTEARTLAPDDADVAAARGALYLRTGRLPDAAADLQAAADRYAARYQRLREAAVLPTLVQLYLAVNDTEAAASAAGRLSALAPNAAVSEYAEALVAYQDGRFADAAVLLQRAVGRQPGNPRFRTLLGATHLAVGNLGQAEQALSRALSLMPDDPAAIKLLAETRLRQQRPEAALDSLRPLAGQGAEDAQIGLLSGLASLQAGNAAQAVVYLEQAAALNPANQAIRLELARAYLAAGRGQAAADLLGGVFGGAGTPGLGAELIRLFGYVQAGEIEQGREQATALIERFPDQPPALTAAAAFHQLIGERQAAMQRLEQAVAADAGFVPARLLLAGLLAEEGRGQEAERHLRGVLAQNATQVQALTALAQLVAARGMADEAETLYTRTLEASPQAPVTVATRLLLARLYLRSGRLDDAEQQIGEAAAVQPQNPDVVATRGLLALARGNAAEAVRLLGDALQRRPSGLGIALALAQAQAANDDLEAARGTLRNALTAVPELLPLRAALGSVELRLGNGGEALAIAQALQTEFPAQAPGYLLEADVRLAERRYGLAAESLGLAFARQPTWDLLMRRAVVLRLAERAGEVEGLIEAWVATHPGHVRSRLTLASLLQAEGRAEEALAHYERILDLDQDNVVALNNAAWLSHEAGRAGALALAERAHELAPDNPAVLDTYGWLLTLRDREQDGIVHLERAAELAPEALEISYHVAYAQAELGRTADARATLERLLAEEGSFGNRAAAEALLESL